MAVVAVKPVLLMHLRRKQIVMLESLLRKRVFHLEKKKNGAVQNTIILQDILKHILKSTENNIIIAIQSKK